MGSIENNGHCGQRKILLLLLVLFIALASQAQDTIIIRKDTSSIKKIEKVSKFYYGGFFNLTFGSYTAIGVEPMIAYKMTPKLSAGAILTYEYISDNRNPGYKYNESNYGASIFGRYRVIPQLYFHTEFSEMNYTTSNSNHSNTSYWVPFLFLGGGFSQQISETTWMNTQIVFDVIQNENSPYSDWEPFFSIGFGVGF